jgi:predicted DNA-binding transcriptional regulator YafY
VTCSDNRWYVLAHDTECGEVRTFALGRITAPVLTSDIPASFNPHKYLGASFNVMKGDGDYEVVIEFDA